MTTAQNYSKQSTQSHLDISEVVDNLVLLKNGGCAMVIQTTTINFGLLSEAEQDALIYSYASFLNSLSFPIQILIRSEKKDVTGYIKSLAKREKSITNPLIKKRVSVYRRFVEYVVQENEVLDKKFYLIIPFSPLEAGLAGSSLLGKTKIIGEKDKKTILDRAKNILTPKREHIITQLSHLGLRARSLTTEELIKLFFSIYNPDVVGQSVPPPADFMTIAVRPNISQAPPNGVSNHD